jgi:SAM-dependent methyltransferase
VSALCVVCGAGGLTLHHRVAGDMGADGLIPTTDRFGTALADVVRCGVCGHGQLSRFPSLAELGEAYAEAASDAYLEEEAGQRETARRVLAVAERHRAAGALLDLGPWVGFLLAEAKRRGWAPVVGVEPSAFAAAYARERLGLDVRTDDLMTADLPAGGFDAVVLGDVIEHLPNPAAALDRVAGLLAPGGVVVLMLPDAGSRLARAMGARWWSVIPTHVQYFTRGSMRRLLQRCGFEVLHLGTAPKAFTVRYYLDRIAGYSPPAARAVNRVAAALGLDRRLWAPDFRDRMLVVACRSDEDRRR